jgi:outer membrane protein TolC
MSNKARPRAVPLAVLFALLGLSSSAVAQIPSPSATPQNPPITQPGQLVDALKLDEALRLANTQASTFRSALLNERLATEDVRQAQAAFLPAVRAPLSYIYTTPALGLPPGEPRVPSFIASDAISVYQAFVNVSGDFDIAGRLRATLARNRALLAAAHAGTDVARRALAQAVIEAYYGLALAIAWTRLLTSNMTKARPRSNAKTSVR